MKSLMTVELRLSDIDTNIFESEEEWENARIHKILKNQV
jgi:hypothetical protein